MTGIIPEISLRLAPVSIFCIHVKSPFLSMYKILVLFHVLFWDYRIPINPNLPNFYMELTHWSIPCTILDGYPLVNIQKAIENGPIEIVVIFP